ncbi:MAG: amino acid adenylation domain-containing protein [Stellaceae bacterium]
MLSGEAERAGPKIAGVKPRGRGMPSPISPEQEHVWLHASVAGDLPLYNEPITIHRHGSFNLALLKESFNYILSRHEIWRTAFVLADGAIRQIVHDELRIAMPMVDLSHLPEAEREAEALCLATADARAPFDLSCVPLLRARVFKLAKNQHRLYLTLHHIIFDGVSIYRVVIPELISVYEALARGRRPELAKPVLQYGDYALWRERSLAGDIAPQMDYWRRHLAGELPTVQLPYDRARPVRLSYCGSMERFSLSAELTQSLKELSRNENVTLYMTLLAAFKVLLHRYSGSEDILIGGVVDTRRRPELESLVGYFLNSVVLRTYPTGDMPFCEYLTLVEAEVLGALAASDVPFDRVVQELRPKRDPSCHPIFQILFSMEPPATAFLDGWDLTQMEVTVGTAKFDLYLELDERPEGIIGRFLYSTDLFDAATIRRMIGHWTRLLESVTATPDRTLADLPLLGKRELRQLLVEWSDTHRDYRSITLQEWFTSQARRTPDAIAVAFGESAWTYRELDCRAEQLAARLGAAGVRRETLVGICAERSPDMMAGLLAILKAEGAYLPCDPELPPARLAFILDDAKPAVLLTQRKLAPRLASSDARLLFLEDGGEVTEAAPRADPGAGIESLAYVLYTSGSTGKPKGVEVPHRALINLLASMQREPGFGADDALLAVTTFSFDIAALELFLPLVSGGKVILSSREEAADPVRLAALIRRSRCTAMQATPSAWRSLIEAGWSGEPGLKILCGGEALPPDLAEELLTRGASLWNMYGPTETTIWSALHRVQGVGAPVPIGRPIANTRMYILDSRGNPVPIGVAGELHIAGEGLARGYRNHADLTSERFVTRDQLPGERLYRTGDIARILDDGLIEYLGRTDAQVKIRGFRVGLAEIEAALESFIDIAAAAVKPWPHAVGERNLVAYVVVSGATVPQTAELRQRLEEILPSYMVPSRIVHLPALPLTPNGKVDRNRLPEPPADAPPVGLVAPLGEHEQRLAKIWQELLGIAAIGRHDDFFGLGGYSLLASKLLRRIETVFGTMLAMWQVYHASTLAQMAAVLTDIEPPSGPTGSLALEPVESRPGLLWLHAETDFWPLAKEMGPDQQFVSVWMDPDELGLLADLPCLADIAVGFVRAIRFIQPAGPYCIGGFCTYGILALEVAAQLTAGGEEVGLVILLDAVNPKHFRQMGSLNRIFCKLKFHLISLRQLRGADRRRYALARLRHRLARLRAIALRRRLVISGLMPSFHDVLERAALLYEPKPYAGPVVLLQPTRRWVDYRTGWTELLTGAFSALDCPGDHNSMLEEPNVQVLGATIRACLSRARVARGWREAAE